MRLVDTHCHLDDAEFDQDRISVIERARTLGVVQQVIPAVDRASWDAIAALCAEHDGLYPAYGLHPMFLENAREEHIDELHEFIAKHPPVAIGECGLDFYVEDADVPRQKWFLDQQLRIARDVNLPVILHARRAVDDVIAAIRQFAPLRGVVHSFPGSFEQAKRLFDLGFLISLGGPVTYPRANKLRTLMRDIPLEWLMLESDAPDQPDVDFRGKRNEPMRVLRVCKEIAALRDETPEHIAFVTTANAVKLFGLPDAP